MGAGLLLSGGEVDFMIKGVFSFEIGGQTLWITTTHICLLIVVLTLCIFALCAHRIPLLQHNQLQYPAREDHSKDYPDSEHIHLRKEQDHSFLSLLKAHEGTVQSAHLFPC